jgi:rare lipoprotein A
LRISNWRLHVRTALALMSLSLAVSCATQQELPQASLPAPVLAQPAPLPSLPAAPQTGAKPSKAVRASYQGTAQAGQPTASGEPYNPNDLTAASRTLPIGSSVVVTNPVTGSSVKVRINDRGPYVRGRSLDLSKRAAEKIGMTRKGVAKVKVKRADSTAETSESPDPSADSSSSTPNSPR